MIDQELLSLPSNASFQSVDEAVGFGKDLVKHIDNLQWVLGDFAIIVERDLGPALSDVAAQMGVEEKTLRRYRDIAKRYPQPLREKFPKLAWTHFKRAAGQPDAEKWLELADDNDWSTDMLAIQIRDKGAVTPLPADRPRLVECLTCNGWYMIKGKQCEVGNGKH
jgi:hypothetical protein